MLPEEEVALVHIPPKQSPEQQSESPMQVVPPGIQAHIFVFRLQIPVQQFALLVQVLPILIQLLHVPLSQIAVQHCAFVVQDAPLAIHPLDPPEEVLPEEPLDVDDVLQTRWSMLHKEVPGIQQVDVPPVQVGTKLAVLQEAVSPFGQILPDVQSWHV